MNVLPFTKQVDAIAALTEGVSIRATERLTGIHRDSIMRLGVRVGQGCAILHDRLMVNVQVAKIELDEIWSFVGKKQKRVQKGEGDEIGDVWAFLALDALTKAILSSQIGKRTQTNTNLFVADLRKRVINRPQISSDAFFGYATAVGQSFGTDVDYGIVEKHYTHEPAREAARRYSPGKVVSAKRTRVIGKPKRASTSYIERQNLNLRMSQRRYTRLTNGFSKKFENHKAAVALYIAHYNFCRVHETTRTTPAMALGITDHVWSVAELVEAALQGVVPEEPQGRQVGRFTVFDGGKD
jgi:IS1 family transposase